MLFSSSQSLVPKDALPVFPSILDFLNSGNKLWFHRTKPVKLTSKGEIINVQGVECYLQFLMNVLHILLLCFIIIKMYDI